MSKAANAYIAAPKLCATRNISAAGYLLLRVLKPLSIFGFKERYD